MVTLTGSFSRLSAVKIAVIGDYMLDTYTIGKARRISPEAPVAVVNVLSEEQRAGGAGNVVLNLLSMGATVLAIGRIGDDSAGQKLNEIFMSEGLSTAGFFVQDGYQTPVKNRIIAENQQIVRVDHERPSALCEQLEKRVIDALPRLLDGIEVIAISDYAKGFLSRSLLSAIIEYAQKHKRIVIADPKGTDFSKYSGATIIKPNLSEVYAAANLPVDAPIEHAAAKALEIGNAPFLMVTRSEAGISLFYRNGERHDFPVRVHEVKDVTGAGDTVLAMLACALASGLDIREAVPLCNIAASIAIERLGCARISLSDLARKMLKLDSGNKVFDCEHIFALQQALKGEKVFALNLQHCTKLDDSTFQMIREFGNIQGQHLIVYLGVANSSSLFVSMLKELLAVDYILIGEMEFDSVCEVLEIEEVNVVHSIR
jgi:rfaE bifunctional protein kinase chain/domain